MLIQRSMFKNRFLKLYSNFMQFSNFTECGSNQHVSVLLEEAVSYLDVGPSKTFIDMTFGAGGHSREILGRSADVKVYALDRDPVAHEHAVLLAEEYPEQIIPMLGKFSDLPGLLKKHGVQRNTIDGILFDFGCSSMQFDKANRGFSLSKDSPLDMRMGGNHEQITAADFLAKIDESDLAKILKVYGGENAAKRIARTIVESRSVFSKIETTKQLADIVSSCMSQSYRLDKLCRPAHLATKTFQAIRIFINNELNEINYGMILSQRLLKTKGRLVTITFHSLEDTIVKRHLDGNIIQGLANSVPLKYSSYQLMYDKELVESLAETNWKQLHKHVIVSSDEEVSMNARSRSAKLRAAVKVR